MYYLLAGMAWQVIAGIETAVRSMKVGGVRRVIIPPSQGYQNTTQEPLPPNVCFSYLTFLFLSPLLGYL